MSVPENRRRLIRMTPAEQAAFLAAHRKAALATIGRDGFPHIVAMNFVVRDGAFCMTSYAKAQKVLNIRRNPQVALMVETGADYAELRGVMVRGRCTIIEDTAAVRRAMAELSGRPEAEHPSAAKRVLLHLVPEKITSWDHRKLGGRY